MNDLVHLVPASLADSSRTLRELAPRFLQWFAFVRLRRPNTVENYGRDLRAFLGFCERAELSSPEQLTFRHVEFWLGLMQSEGGLAPQSCNRHLYAVRAFWKWMRREGVTSTDPTADVSPLPIRRKLPDYLPVPEQEKVLTTLALERTLLGRRDHALIGTGLLTGLRNGELGRLQVAHLDLEASVLRVVQGKNRKDRELPIVPRLAAILRGYLAETRPTLLAGRVSPYVFVRIGPWARSARVDQPLGGKAIFYLVRAALTPLIGRPVHPHMLRHSFATRLRANGADLQLMQEAMGHASIVTTTMYAHLATPQRLADLARLLE